MFDPKKIRKDFPILETKVNGKDLVYLDNAATTQKCSSVIEGLRDYYEGNNANVHRGVHHLSVKATGMYEATREAVRSFINANSIEEVIFTGGTTDSINLVASSWGEENIDEGDEVVVSLLEHHSNLVPWQQLCKKKKAVLKYIPITKDGQPDLSDLNSIISDKTKLVAISDMSNALGTIIPVKDIIEVAHNKGAVVLVDGAQGVPHFNTDVQELGCDFLAFSAHKMLGPTGVGVLYGKKNLLEKMKPYRYGGEMIKEVHQQESSWNDLPYKFEAGTPNIAGISAFKGAIDYLRDLGMDQVLKHDQELRGHAFELLSNMKGIEIYGPRDSSLCGGILSFNVNGVHAHDVGSILDSEGVAVRAGHHCAQPLMERLGVNSTVRMSFYIYNTIEEVEIAVEGLKKVNDIFKIN